MDEELLEILGRFCLSIAAAIACTPIILAVAAFRDGGFLTNALYGYVTVADWCWNAC